MKSHFSKLILCLLLFSTSILTAQQNLLNEENEVTYKIIVAGNNPEVFTKTLNHSKLNKYRLKSKNHQLKFKDGEIIELFSASDLFSKGFIGSVTEYRDDNYYEGTIFSFDEKTKEVYIYENSNKKNLEAKIPASVFYIINDKPVSREEYMKHLQQTENKK